MSLAHHADLQCNGQICQIIMPVSEMRYTSCCRVLSNKNVSNVVPGKLVRIAGKNRWSKFADDCVLCSERG
jgi:hypothetical protein